MIKKILKNNWILVLILLAALLVRVIGVKPGYPSDHPDEPMSYSSAVEMIVNNDLDPRRYDYPAGVPLVHYLFFRLFFLPLALFKLFFPHPRVFLTAIRIGNRFLTEFREPIFGRGGINTLFFSRYITVILGTGTVFLTYLLTKKLFNKTAGLMAAFFLAFNFRHVLSSHLALSDIPNCFFTLLALYTSVLLLEKNSRKRYLLAGLCVGLAFSIKYQIFSFFPFLFVHLVWARRKKSFKRLFNLNFLFGLFLIPAIFIILNPYLFLHLKEALPVIKYVALRYGMGAKKFNFYPLFYLYHWGISRLPSLVIIFGLIFALVLEPVKTFFLLTFLLPFFFVFVYYSLGGGYVRNFTTAIPFLTIFAGFCLSSLFQVAQRLLKLPQNFLLTLFVILAFWFNFVPIKNLLVLDYFYSQIWNRNVFDEWLIKNLPAEVQLRAYPIYLPRQAQLGKKVRIVNWNRKKENSLAEFREAGDDFVALNLTFNWNYMYWWFNLPLKQMIKYPGLPYEILGNGFEGLAIKELLPYTVAEVYKPWQAVEEINYLLFKIPQAPAKLGNQIATFNFDKQNEGWRAKGNFGYQVSGFSWNSEEGYQNKGSLEIQGGKGDFLTTHFSSPPIPVKAGKFYTTVGWIKNSKNLEIEERDGFLRLDFYGTLEEANLEKPGIKIALSSRAWGKGDWVKKEVVAVAPEEAKYLTISFQRGELSYDFSSYLDNIILFESEEMPEERFKELPYIEPTIPENILYPNSIL